MSKIRKMTNNERMVWAAVFAKEFDLHSPPSRCMLGEARDIWEAGRVHSAVECAGAAIVHLREQREAINEGWENMDIAVFANQMIDEV